PLLLYTHRMHCPLAPSLSRRLSTPPLFPYTTLFRSILGRFNRRKARHGCAQLGEALAHNQFVLGVNQRSRLWLHVIACIDQRGEVLIRHVLMVKSDSGGTVDGFEQVVVVGVITKHYIRAYLCRRGIACAGEKAQRLAELNGGGLHHAS